MNIIDIILTIFVVVYLVTTLLPKTPELKEFPKEKLPEIIGLIKNNQEIEALKSVRKITFWPLRKAKDFVIDLKSKNLEN